MSCLAPNYKIIELLENLRVNLQVETVGTVYMLVSGAPERRRAHAASAASAALAISRAIPALTIGKKCYRNIGSSSVDRCDQVKDSF